MPHNPPSGTGPLRPLLLFVPTALIFLALFRLADTLVPMVFNRPFNLYLDTHSYPDPFAHAGSRKPGNQPPGDGIVFPGCRTHWRNGCG